MAQGYLTTHVLDTSRGVPAAGVPIALFNVTGGTHNKIAEAITNGDGRTDAPILPQDQFAVGTYTLIFFCGAYFESRGLARGDTKFLDQIPIRFGIDDADAHFHVPLLLSPYGYSTYRGS